MNDRTISEKKPISEAEYRSISHTSSHFLCEMIIFDRLIPKPEGTFLSIWNHLLRALLQNWASPLKYHDRRHGELKIRRLQKFPADAEGLCSVRSGIIAGHRVSTMHLAPIGVTVYHSLFRNFHLAWPRSTKTRQKPAVGAAGCACCVGRIPMTASCWSVP